MMTHSPLAKNVDQPIAALLKDLKQCSMMVDTILHLIGFDHEKLTYRHAGRDYRLTDVEGHVVKEIIV